MKVVSQAKIDDLIENGYALRVSEYISGGIQMVKDHLGLFVGFTVLLFIINSFSGIVPFGTIAVGAPLSAGFFLAANKINRGYELELADFFKGFEYFGQLVVYSILVVLFFATLAIPFSLFIFSMVAFNFDTEFMVLFGVPFGLMIAAISVYMSISFMWAPYLIVFAKKKAWDSIETSHKIIKKDFLNFMGFGLLLVLLNFVGFMCFGVGLLFTIPATACALYLAFEDVTEMRLEADEDYLQSHLVE